MMNKKGDLSLSIQTIVIVVIAFTVLGLGLTFVKNQIGGIGKTSSEVQAKIKEQILEDLRTSGKKLSLSQEVKLERGKEVVESIGIVNTGIKTSKFGVQIEPIKKQNPDGTPGKAEDMVKEINFFYNDVVEKELSPTQGDVIPVTITAKGTAAGNYLYKVNVLQEETDGACIDGVIGGDCKLYDTKSFFVKVS